MKYNKDFVLFTLSLKLMDKKERKLVICVKHLYFALNILLATISSLVMVKSQLGYFPYEPGNRVFNYSVNSLIMIPMVVIFTISSYIIGTTLFSFIRNIRFSYFSLIVCLFIFFLKVRAFLYTFSYSLEVFWEIAFISLGIGLTRIVVAWILANLIVKKVTVVG